MSANRPPARQQIGTQRVFRRFTRGQRWEHAVLVISFTVLLLTGLPQKYFELWGHFLLSSPQRIEAAQYIHRVAAVVLILEVIYHLVHNLILLVRRRLPGSIFPTWQDIRDAWQMLKYLLFLRERPPAFGKYNFEQKFTYWFLFLGIGIMVITGLILWFPILWTYVFPGATVPAAHLAHSSEAIVATIFLIIWHFYHVHIERLNLSIFTGFLNEREMRRYHGREFEQITGEPPLPEGPPPRRAGQAPERGEDREDWEEGGA